MGEVIRASADTKEIVKDARKALDNAIPKSGKIKERAEEILGPVLVMIDAIEQELAAAIAVLAPLLAALKAENDNADATINRTYDDTWNDVGRPAIDRSLALMYPGGAAYYTDGDTPDQPNRMELLAKLYDRKIHPKLTDQQAALYATRIRDAAGALKADLDAVAVPAANVELLKRVQTALGRAAQFELANLKRAYKIDGMSEAEIHDVIPDRPVAKKASKKTDAAKPTPEATEPK